MWVECGVVALLGPGAGVLQRHHVGDVEPGVIGQRRLVDRVVDAGLERLLVHDQVGLEDTSHLLGRELDVMRLGARAGEVVDAGVAAADPLGDVRERVRSRDDRDAGTSTRTRRRRRTS